MKFWFQWYIKHCISKIFNFCSIAIMDFTQMGSCQSRIDGASFPVIYDTFADLFGKFQLFINFF